LGAKKGGSVAKDLNLPPEIRLSRSGKYQIRYTGPDGHRYAGGTYRTKTDAKQALSIIQASISDRSWKTKKAAVDGELSGKSTLSEWSEEWIRTRVSKSTGEPLATLTVKGYRTIIGSSLASFDRPIESVTSSQIRKWWTAYRIEYPRGANSAYKYLSSLLSYAVKRRAIVENPCDIEGATRWVAKPKPQLSSKDSIDRLIQETENPWRVVRFMKPDKIVPAVLMFAFVARVIGLIGIWYLALFAMVLIVFIIFLVAQPKSRKTANRGIVYSGHHSRAL
jgi:hypothetical protein